MAYESRHTKQIEAAKLYRNLNTLISMLITRGYRDEAEQARNIQKRIEKDMHPNDVKT